MAGPRRGAGMVLVALGGLLLAIIAVWDMSRPDSFLRDLFGATPNPGSNVRSIVDGVRSR